MKRPSGKDLGGYRKRGWWTLAPRLWQSLSPHSVCKKSPNLLAALLPLPDLSLKQWQRAVQPSAGKGRVPGAIRPKKQYIKPCETCFANTLNLNDKGPSLKWICFPKSYSPVANWLRISPQSSLLSVIWSVLPEDDWWALPVFLCKLNPIKPIEEKAFDPSPLRDRPPFLPKQIMSWQTYSHPRRLGGPCGRSPPTKRYVSLYQPG